MTAHERTPCLLVEWIEPEQVLSVIDRIGKRSFPFKQANQARQDLLRALTQTFAISINPIAGAIGQHVALVQGCRLFERIAVPRQSAIRGGVEGDQVHDGVTVFIPREK